jgi:subtilisin
MYNNEIHTAGYILQSIKLPWQTVLRVKKFAVWILVVIALVFGSITNSFSVADAKSGGEKVRVLAESDEQSSAAVELGCQVVRETKGLKALFCDPEDASTLRLKEDIRLFAVDTAANSQIKANTVQASGNNGSGTRIVILDSGYNYNHPDLSLSYVAGYDFVNGDNNPLDDNGHGSHVAGLITSDGIYSAAKGVAPGAGIIAGKVLDSAGSGFFSDIVAAIYWAVDGPDGVYGTSDDFDADAISMSLGTSPPYTYKGFCDFAMPSMTQAISYAVSKDIVVVVAAGNSGRSGVSIPGCISYSTTVGAVSASDKIASFSGRGSAVDISAPGVSLISTWLGNGYATASGTSMATPVVSGTVALVKYSHPSYSASQVESALFGNAKDLGKAGKDTSYGYGRVDASLAVQ